MYIKQIKLYFNTNDKALEVVGSEAQRIFESQLERVVSVTVDGKMLFIPRSSILYIEAIPHEEANSLQRKIDDMKRDLFEEIDAHVDVDILYFEHWELERGKLKVFDAGIKTVWVDEPCFIQTYKEIIDMEQKLAKLVGEAV